MGTYSLFGPQEVQQEDVAAVLRDIMQSCDHCRLSLLHPNNRGFIYRGTPFAKIALVHEAPRDSETERGVAMIGSHGRVVEDWLRFLGLNSQKEVFITTVVQCQPPRVQRQGKSTQREPDMTEVAACLSPRCMRVLRAMPNLEVVIALGWFAAGALLGFGETPNDKPKAKTHDAQWFESSQLPGIPIFCMVDPVWVVKDPSPEKSALAEHALEHFKREYIEKRKVIALAEKAKAKREEEGLGLF